MPWYDDEIAGPMGYKYCVLFDCARDALKAWPHGIVLPGNVCRSVYAVRPDAMLEEVDQTTGLAKYAPVHLYGYQSPGGNGYKLTLDPLMTGWVRRLKTESAIVSFGCKKMASLGYGGAFLTSELADAEMMGEYGHWNERYTQPLIEALNCFVDYIEKRRQVLWLWDQYLGDSLIRIPAEQLMPWRVMRRAHTPGLRTLIVKSLRDEGLAVGTNYPPLTGSNDWGDTVLNFPCWPFQDKAEIQKICELIKWTVDADG